MTKPQKDDLESTRALMGALLRQPPKHHDEMKIKKAKKAKKSKPSKRAKA